MYIFKANKNIVGLRWKCQSVLLKQIQKVLVFVRWGKIVNGRVYRRWQMPLWRHSRKKRRRTLLMNGWQLFEKRWLHTGSFERPVCVLFNCPFFDWHVSTCLHSRSFAASQEMDMKVSNTVRKWRKNVAVTRGAKVHFTGRIPKMHLSRWKPGKERWSTG